MGNWGFIGLAYGLATVALLAYFFILKGRLRQAREELASLEKDTGRKPR